MLLLSKKYYICGKMFGKKQINNSIYEKYQILFIDGVMYNRLDHICTTSV